MYKSEQCTVFKLYSKCLLFKIKRFVYFERKEHCGIHMYCVTLLAAMMTHTFQHKITTVMFVQRRFNTGTNSIRVPEIRLLMLLYSVCASTMACHCMSLLITL